MSEQDKKKTVGSKGSLIMVDMSASSRLKPYRPNELQEESKPELHNRSKAPAVAALPDDLKNISLAETTDPDERTEHTMSEKRMEVSKKSSGNRQETSPDETAIVSLEVMKDNPAAPAQPIPAQIKTVGSGIVDGEDNEKPCVEKIAEKRALQRAEEDSITEEITELRTDAAVKEDSEWSDDEGDPGRIPRSESRASRVSRAVRTLFCCGTAHLAPSEENIPSREFSGL